jgi:hypothetical protein
MQQKELAKLLDISPSMVSRLVGKGMPTDTLDRAKKWRKRHLEPGRIKGSRYDPKHDQAAAAVATVPSAPAAKPETSVDVLEAVALELNAALIYGDKDEASECLQHFFSLFQRSISEEYPCRAGMLVIPRQSRFPLRVWIAVFHYYEYEHVFQTLRDDPSMDQIFTFDEFGEQECRSEFISEPSINGATDDE